MSVATVATRPPSLLSREYLPFVVGAVALVTLGAFENRAVLTVLPTVATDLDGLRLFGAASAASMSTYVVSLAVAGAWADHRGSGPVLRWGLGAFVLGQLAAGLAPSMGLFIAGRLASGFAEGLIDIALMVLVARALPEALRAKVFAAYAAAWILPSLLGPALAGWLTEELGWRTVFLASLGLLVPVWLLLRPSVTAVDLDAPPPTPWSAEERRAAYTSVAAAAALVAVSSAGPLVDGDAWGRTLGATLLIAGFAVLYAALRAILPPGTFTLGLGLPAVAGLRGLVGASFGTIGAYFPLMLATVHHLRPAAAGVSLMVTGSFWAAGSWLHARDVVQRHVPAVARLRLGFSLIAVGVVGPLLLALSLIPLWAGLAGWAVAATGMGIASPTLATLTLGLSPATDHGRASAAAQLAGSVGLTVTIALAGAAIAWQAPQLDGRLFAGIAASGVVLGGLGALLSGRAR